MGAADNGYQEKDFLIYSHLLLKEGHFEESEKYKAIVQSYLKTLRVCHNSFSFYNSSKDMMANCFLIVENIILITFL